MNDNQDQAGRLLAALGQTASEVGEPEEFLAQVVEACAASGGYLLGLGERRLVASTGASAVAQRADALIELLGAPGSRPALGRIHPVRLPDAVFHVAMAAGGNGDILLALDLADQPVTDELESAIAVAVELAAARLETPAADGQAAERRARAVLAASLDAVITIDAEGLIVDFTPAAERVFGHRRESVLGTQLADLIIPQDFRQAHHDGLARYLETGYGPVLNRRLNLPALHADGRVIQIELVITPLDVEGGQLFTGFARDVTETLEREAQMEAMSSRLEALIANFGSAVLVENESRQIVLVNEEFLAMFGVDAEPESLVGADCAAADDASSVLFADPEGFLAGIERLLGSRRPRLDEELTMADGRTLERNYVSIFVDDVYRGHLWLYRDISGRKGVEREREALLDRERASREALEVATQRLEKSNEELRELDRLRTELVATVSHELRTPLTSIVSLSELLADPDGGELDEEQREFVEIIERNAGRLLRVIDDLLLLARLDTGRLELNIANVDIGALVRESVAALAHAAEERGVDLVLDAYDGPPILGDRERLGQVVDNLISNAIKFTPSGGRVEVVARPAEGAWRVAVADTGVGIPADEQGRLFQRFFRASSAAGSEPGSGLGLAIVQGIVDRHGGQIALESAPGRGTTVSVDLPAAAALTEQA